MTTPHLSESNSAEHGTDDGAADASEPPLLSVRGLKTYYDDDSLLSRSSPVRAVDGVSFDVHEGETLGLVGESGCGKTTLGRTLLGLEDPNEGAVMAEGRDVTDLDSAERLAWQRRVGMVFQDPQESLNDRQTVGEIVREPLDRHDWPHLSVAVEDRRTAGVGGGIGGDGTVEADGASGVVLKGSDVTAAAGEDRPDVTVTLGADDRDVSIREELPLSAADFDVSVERGDPPVVRVSLAKEKAEVRRDRVRDLLDRVGLREEHYYRYPHQFSGGQRQRVGIARALALEPEFVVLDEPVSALDVSVQARIINLLADLQVELGLSYLFIAHDLSVVRHIADRVAVMYLGNVVEIGPTEAVYGDPAHPYTLSLLSAIPGSGSPWNGERVSLPGTPPSPRDPPEGCPFATRCPAKIRSDEYELSEEAWRAIEELRVVFRTRARTGDSLVDVARRALGRSVGGEELETVVADLLGEHSLSDDVRARVDAAVDRARVGDDAAAADALRTAVGSRCDREHPGSYDAGEGRESRCLRRESDYRNVAETVAARQSVDQSE